VVDSRADFAVALDQQRAYTPPHVSPLSGNGSWNVTTPKV
jgi:hypothetical protein